MGSRAVISIDTNAKALGVYLHWHGGAPYVLAFLDAAKRFHISPGDRQYFWARFSQMIGNFIGGTMSLGIDIIENLDKDNCDNGWYIVGNDLSVVERRYSRTGNALRVNDLNENDKATYKAILDEVIKANKAFFRKEMK